MKRAACLLATCLFAAACIAAPASLKPLPASGVPALLQPPAHGTRVIALWALDCVYCVADLKALDALHRKHPNIQVVTVATDNYAAHRTALSKRLQAAGVTDLPAYAYAAATPGRINYLIDPHWGGATPRTLVIHADGRRAATSGQLTPQSLRRLLNADDASP